MSGNPIRKIGVVSTAELNKFAKVENMFLKIAIKEKAAKVFSMLGGTGDPAGFGSVLLCICIDSRILDFKAWHCSIKWEDVFRFLHEFLLYKRS